MYHDIVTGPAHRLCLSDEIDGTPISVSLTAIELALPMARARVSRSPSLAFYLDGYEDKGARAHGVGLQIDKLGETLPD
ncbi:MAG: hypothetical protein WDN44_06250 [Sphingomonas sp.]